MTGKLNIAVAARQTTYLKDCYFTHPFKVASIREDRLNPGLRLMIMSSSPGVLSNDRYEVNIDVYEGAALELVTQGYQRLFTMQNFASQQVNISLKENTSFIYLPHPAVPHSGSSFATVNNIHLQGSHNLVWSEILTCGRKLSGEIFLFNRYQSLTSIYIYDRLVIRENLLLEPDKRNPSTTGQLEGYTHQSGLLFINDRAEIEPLIDACRSLLSVVGGISFGVSLLPVNGLIVRILGIVGNNYLSVTIKLPVQSVN